MFPERRDGEEGGTGGGAGIGEEQAGETGERPVQAEDRERQSQAQPGERAPVAPRGAVQRPQTRRRTLHQRRSPQTTTRRQQ